MASESPQTTIPDVDASAEDMAPGPGAGVSVRPVAFTELGEAAEPARPAPDAGTLPLDVILDVEVPIVVELGHTEMLLQDLLALRPGSVVELDKLAGEPADLLIRGHVVAQGEVVVIDDSFGIRITNIVDPGERVKPLR